MVRELIVLIPTCKSKEDITPLVDVIKETVPKHIEVVATCGVGESASWNRNVALDHASIGEIVIMIDDDVSGFYNGWAHELTAPLVTRNDIVMVSARLLKPSGALGYMMGENYDTSTPMVEVLERRLPTACIAFVYDGTRFDENFKGSGFEDTDFCKILSAKYPTEKFVINNIVRLVHANEMKNQNGEYWKSNKAYFVKKYPEEYEREMGRK